jgi:hypothetical protein
MGRYSFPVIDFGKLPVDHLVDSMKVGRSLGTRVARPYLALYNLKLIEPRSLPLAVLIRRELIFRGDVINDVMAYYLALV